MVSTSLFTVSMAEADGDWLCATSVADARARDGVVALPRGVDSRLGGLLCRLQCRLPRGRRALGHSLRGAQGAGSQACTHKMNADEYIENASA